jgi:hypothetical protein
MVDDQELRRRIREVLVPGGSPLGRPGRNTGIREVQGDLQTAREVFDKLEELGVVVNKPTYPGNMVRQGSEGNAGLRPISKHGGPPTIDVKLDCVPGMRKIKFV